MERIFISLGSNMGDKVKNLIFGIEKMRQIDGLILHFISPLYETEPVGIKDPEPFFNCTVECGYHGTPLELLERLEKIEKEAGRISKGDYSSRPLDMDIIFFGDRILNIPSLTIPHPRFYDRKFVLIPLTDLDPDFKCPKTGKTMSQLLEETDDKSMVTKLDPVVFGNILTA